MPGYRADDSIGLLSLGGEFASPILDPLFTDVRSGGSSWSPGQQSAWEVRDVTFDWAESDQYLALTPDAWDGGRYGVYYGPWRVGIPVSSGELWRLEWNRFRLDADGELFSSVNVQFFREDGSEFWLGTVEYTGANSSSRQELEFTVPDGAVGMRPYWVLSSDGIRMGIADPVMTRLVDDELPAARVLQDAAWEFEERQESTNRLEVTVPLSEARDVKTKDELTFQGRRFVVDEVDRSRASDEAVIVADEAQVQLSQIQMADWRVDSWVLEDAVSYALEGTGWTIGDLSGDQGRFARFYMEDVSVLEALKTAARHQDARVVFDSMLRRVHIVPGLSDGPDRVFTYGSELSNIEKSEEAPTLTEIRPVGEDGLTIASVNDGSEILEDYSYWTDQGMSLEWARSHFRMNETWEDSRYTVAENLLRDAQKRLAEESHPKINVTLSVAPVARGGDVPDDLADLIEQAQGHDLSQLHLGDQVWVWDQETETKIRAEVKVVKTSSDASQNEVELGYLPDSLGQGVEGRYRGDSGRPDNGPGGRPSLPGSGPQPRPSMPILEDVDDLGNVTLRWNGQDHEGNTSTIPERFGEVSVIGAEVVDGVVPSPTSEDAFGGGSVNNRGGGLVHISVGAGEYAFWFYMVGQDGVTRSELSEPLTVEVEALVDTEWIRDRLDEAEGRIDEAEQEFRQGQEDLDGRLGDLKDRQDSLSDDLVRGLDDLDTSLREEIVTAGGNRIFRSTGDPEPLSPHGYALLTTPGAGQAIVGYDMEGQPDQPVAPGGEVELSWVKRTGQGPEEYHRVALVFLDSEGSQVGETHTRDFPAPEYGDGDECRTVFTAPEEGATHVYFAWQVNASEPGWGIEAPSLRVDGEERLGPLRTLDERPGEIVLVGMELRSPSREAVEGDRWEQWDTLSTGGKLLATWRHDGEQWVEEELDETYLPRVHIGQGTYGELEGDRLTAHSVNAQHLQVGSFENLFPDPSFRLFRDYGTGEQSPWRYINGDLDRYEWDSHDSVGASLLAPEGAGQAGMEVDCGEVRAGEKMSASFTIRRDSGTSSGGFQIWARHRDEDGSLVSGENVTLINSVIGNQSSTQETYTLTWDTPDDPSIASLWIYFRMTESLDGNVRISDPYVRRMVDGEVIVDGAITARKVDTEEFFSDEAVIETIWSDVVRSRLIESEGIVTGDMIATGAVTARTIEVTDELIADLFVAMEARIDQLVANSIDAMEISAGQVTSGTFVGRTFRTNPDAMDLPGSGGGVLIENRPDGPFRIYDQDGSWTVVLGGSRHQMRDIEVAELHLTGEIRVGRGGEGALMPAAGDRLRMEGRIPDTALGPRDTIVQGTTDFVTTSGGSMRSWDLAYPAPTPAGVRMPVVSANISNQHTSPDGLAATSTQARTADGFRVWTQPLFSSGSVRYAMTYIGVWGFQTSA